MFLRKKGMTMCQKKAMLTWDDIITVAKNNKSSDRLIRSMITEKNKGNGTVYRHTLPYVFKLMGEGNAFE